MPTSAVNAARYGGDRSVNDRSTRRSAETKSSYRRRYRQLATAAAKDCGGTVSAARLVEWTIEKKRPTWSAATWRQNRAALRYGLECLARSHPAHAEECKLLIDKLENAPPAPPKEGTLRTSQQKAKRVKRNDLARICHRLLAGQSPNAGLLVDVLRATALTALRPTEWRSARFDKVDDRSLPFQLVVENAKHDAVRAHGRLRTLRWPSLNQQLCTAIANVIEKAQSFQSDADYRSWLNTLRDLMHRTTKELFPRRKRRPTLYTFRHEAIARFKATYVTNVNSEESRANGRAIVAALCGHATDETATRHYGRPRRGERATLPVPEPDPAEVARIRLVMAEKYDRLATRTLENRAHTPV